MNPADQYYAEDEDEYGDEGNLQGLYVEGLSDRIWEENEQWSKWMEYSV